MPTTDRLADVILMASIELARLEAGGQDDIDAALASLFRRLQRQLREADLLEPATLAKRLQRVRAFAQDSEAAIIATYATLAAQDQAFREAGAVLYAQQIADAGNAALGQTVFRRGRGARRLETLASTQPVQGVPAADWWGRQAATVSQQLGDRLRRHVLNDQPAPVLRQELTALERTATRHAETLIQTSLASISQQALTALLEANAEAFRGVQWVTTLDSRACPICIALSGQAWTLDHTPLGDSSPWPGEPPIHHNCRCVLVPVLKGSRLSDILAFEPWLRTRPVAEQRAILGPGRYALWQAGTIQLRQLIDQRHRPLRLDQLRSDSAA